jgi:hypothetical protein
MKTNLTVLFVVVAIFSVSCASMKNRTIRIEESTPDSYTVIKIDTLLRSYFDPDGFSREYHPHVTIRVYGKGKKMAYHPGTIFRFGKDFDVDIDYCSGGYIWISEDRSTLGVALFDIDAPSGFKAIKRFNGSYLITPSQADLLLRNK